MARIALGVANAGGSVCTLMTLAIVYVNFAVHTSVSRLTPAVVGCKSIKAVTMDTGIGQAFINVELAVCP